MTPPEAILDVIERLGGQGPAAEPPRPFLVVVAEPFGRTGSASHRYRAAYRELRRRAFVEQQGLFVRDDGDDVDADEDTKVLVAVAPDGAVLGGVRLHPAGEDATLGWWRGSRLVCQAGADAARGRVGAALVAAACAEATAAGALRFDAHVQREHERFFTRLGWEAIRPIEVLGAPHTLMRWPVDRVQQLADATKSPLAGLLDGLLASGAGWIGDDAAPVPGSGLVAATDAITPSMVERDPDWAGWCGMLVTAHDLSAMGADPVGALDALGAADAAAAARVLAGLRRGADAFGLPILGGHTQLGVPAALSVTGLGRTDHPVPAGGGRVGDVLSLTADVEGAWRPGYTGQQWDSTSWRRAEDLRAMLGAVGRARPRAAKDVSMAGILGTAGMLAEASGCGVEIDAAAMVRPAGVGLGDWTTCFPGFGMLTADRADAPGLDAGPAVGGACGRLVTAPGVRLRWPDGDITEHVASTVTGLGPA